MKIVTDTDTHMPTKRAEFQFNGKKMCVVVAMDRYSYGRFSDDMHTDANHQLHYAIEGFLHGQIQDVLKDARFALGL